MPPRRENVPGSLSSDGATSTSGRRATSTSALHAKARAPAEASATLSVARPSSRSTSSANRSLRSTSARTPPSLAVVPPAAGFATLAIELIHRTTQTVARRDLGRLGRAHDRFVRFLTLVGGEGG